jgi:mRNA interferase MazF
VGGAAQEPPPTGLESSAAGATQAQPAVFRPEIELGGVPTRFLVDQLRSIDERFIDGEPAFFLHRRELEAADPP